MPLQLGQLLLQLEERLLEIERESAHRAPSYHRAASAQRRAASGGHAIGAPASFVNQVRCRLAYRRVRLATRSSASAGATRPASASAISPYPMIFSALRARGMRS